MARFALSLFVVLVAVSSASPQTPWYYQTGIPPNTPTIPIPLGSINVFSGKAILEIPIAPIPERNGATAVAKVTGVTGFVTSNPNGGYSGGSWDGFAYGTGDTLIVNYDTIISSCPPQYPVGNGDTKYTNFRVTDVHGSIHLVPINTGPDWPGYTYKIGCTDSWGNKEPDPGYGPNATGTDIDGYGYTFTITYYNLVKATVIDGTVFADPSNPSGVPLDSNGNYLYVSPTDTLGRQAVTRAGNSWGCVQTNTNPGYLYVRASDGSTQTYTLNCQTYNLPGGTVNLASSLVLPNGTQYTFNYDTGNTGVHAAALLSVGLPSGGQVSFQYNQPGYPGLVSSVTFGGSTWNFNYVIVVAGQNSQTTTTVTAPARYDSVSQSYVNDKTVYTSVLGGSPFIKTIQYYAGSSTLLKTVSTTYTGPLTSFPGTVTTTLNDTGQISKVQYQYAVPYRTRPTQIQEWDYGASIPTRTTKITYGGAQYKPASVNIYAGDGTGSAIASTTYTFDEYGANYCSIPMLTNVIGATAHDDTNHGISFLNRGNVTSTSRLVSGTTWVTSHKCYDTLGNVMQEVDEAGHHTTYDYSENWADTSCIPAGTVTKGYPTTITDGIGNRRKTKFYTCTGLAQAQANENDILAGRAGTTYTYDLFGRPLSVNSPDGGQTASSYSDTSVPPYSTVTTLIDASTSISKKTVIDGYGRVTQTQVTTDPEGIDYQDTTYDALGHKASVSNPYRSTSDGTYGLTNYYYDALGRVASVVEPDASSVTTSYSGSTATVTDEALKKRKTQADAFGRLTVVWEDPTTLNYETDYTYDVLGNLLCVQQRGGVSTPAGTGCAYSQSGDNTSPWRIRRYAYDGLSRLTSTTNPESGTSSYSYYSDGLVNTKTSPKPNQIGSLTVITTYSYDTAHRITQKSYNDGATATVKYFYDGVTPTGCTPTPPTLSDSNPKGLRTAMCDASGATSWSHDLVGRVATEKRTINSVTKSVSYQYKLDGSVWTLTYPSAKTVTYAYNGGQHALSAVDSGSNANYVTSATWMPFGQLNSYKNGVSNTFNGITVSYGYNKRLQPTLISAATPTQTIFSLSYGYGTTGQNNGNPSTVVNNLTSGRTQTFTYDALNRISTAQSQATSGTACWGQSFGYDAWGNLQTITQTKCSTPILNASADYFNHMIGFNYDAPGNLTKEGSGTPSWNYAWDGENRLSSISGSASDTFTYDGDGERVKKSNGALFWRQHGGPFLTKTSLSGSIIVERIYFNGLHVAAAHPPSGPVNYLFQDHLGGEHIVTDAAGVVCQDVDSLPFGSEIFFNSACGSSYRFAGMERDDENSANLDYDIARYYDNRLGRFLSRDQPLADQEPGVPQSWNLYSYVRNNPLINIDPTGNTCQTNSSDGTVYDDMDGKGCAQVDVGNVLAPASATVDGSDDDPSYQLANGVSNFTSTSSLSQVGVNGLFYAQTAQFVWNLPGALGRLWSAWKASQQLITLGLEGAADAANAAEAQNLVARAASTVGDQTVRANSRAIAEQAAKKFLGDGAEPITDRVTGAFKGWKSADGTRVVIDTHTDAMGEHMNFRNKTTGGNLHVRW